MEPVVFIILHMFFRNTHSFENWGISLGLSPVLLGNIQLRQAFGAIVRQGEHDES